MRVYLESTGEGDALTAFAQLSRAATARKLAIRIEDPVAFERGSGRFYVHVANADTREDAIAMVRAALDQAPDAVAAFRLASAQEERRRGNGSAVRSDLMEASRLHRVQIDVAGNIVAITWDERDKLLVKLRTVAGCEKVIQRFEAVGAGRPVDLNDEQRSRLRVTLELWGVSVLPDGLARLLIALVQADPGGQVGAGFLARG